MTLLARPAWAAFAFLIAPILPANAHHAPLDFNADLRAAPVLGGLEFDEVEPVRGLIFHVELAPGAEADRADTIADELTEIFEPVESRFEEHFGGLEARSPIHVVITTESETWRAARGQDAPPSPGGADFLPTLGEHGSVVSYDLAWPGSSRRTRLAGLREAFGEALVASHSTTPATALPGALIAGAGRFIGFEDATGTKTLHDRLIATLVEGGFQDAFLSDAAQLMQPAGLEGLWANAKDSTTEAREPDQWAKRRFESRVDQAAQFLAAGLVDEEAKEPTLDWLHATLTASSPEATGLEAAERAAWTFLVTTGHNANPAFDPRGLNGPPAFEAAVASLNLPEPKPKEASSRPEDRLAEGLWLASRGRLEAAHDALTSAASDATAARCLTGIEALQALRSSYLAHLADGGVSEKLRIKYEGKLLAADVTRVGLKSVFLGENSRGVEALPITSIDIGELVGRMEKEKPVFGDPLARAWAQALVGGKWMRSLSIELKKDKVLRADLEGVESQLERGRVLHLLGEVDNDKTASNSARLEAIGSLLSTAASTNEVINAHGHLQDVARVLLAERFEGTDLTSLLSAKSAQMNGDTLSLEYDFASKGELADWPMVDNYSPDFVSQFPELKTQELVRKVDDKMLLVQGAVAFQNVVAFAGPITLTYELSYERTKKKSEAKLAAIDYVYASICDDLAYQHLRTSQFGNLDVVDSLSETNHQENRDAPLSYKLGKTYKHELKLDAKGQLTSKLDGSEVFSTDAHGRSSGRLLFLIHSDRVVRLHSIRIEGKLAEDQTPLREMWLVGQLHELGF